MSARSPAKRVALILLLVVLLPALFYSGYEINSLSGSEELIGKIYVQQLEAILFSLNQYSWDIASSWANALSLLKSEDRRDLEAFLARHISIRAVVFADSALTEIGVVSRSEASGSSFRTVKTLREALRAHREVIARLSRFSQLEYRKLEPVVVSDSSGSPAHILLLFVSVPAPGALRIGGMLLDEPSFIQTDLAPKLRDAARDEFVLSVYRRDVDQPVFSTEQVQRGGPTLRKLLWLFPDYEVGLSLKGQTISEILQGRFYRNLVLIGLLDLVLIAGAVLVYRSLRRELELARLKSDFVSNVSHELRTPLSLIRMFAETLEMGRIKGEEKKQEYYATILRETERLTRLVNNILNFSRMEAGKKSYSLRPLDLNDVISGVLETYGPHLSSEGFTVEKHLAPALPVIEADREAVSEAFINVMDNAVKYSDREHFLRVETGAENGKVFVEVEDRGMGIPPEHQEKIFETFYRVASGPVHNTKGSGLGLALVKQIMDAHRGGVSVRSSPGKGSCFRLAFPSPSTTEER